MDGEAGEQEENAVGITAGMAQMRQPLRGTYYEKRERGERVEGMRRRLSRNRVCERKE
jgi:hypothetical protein